MNFKTLNCIVFSFLFQGYYGLAQETAPEESQEIDTTFSSASLGLVGDPSDVSTDTRAGLVLMGGSTDVDSAIQWMIQRSGGGDVVIIRASGTDAYNEYIFGLGKVNSVETILIDSRQLANNENIAQKILDAEMLFIAGGDQSNYMNYWRGTKTMDALNYLLNIKKIPFGGTSAGCAILGSEYFSGENGSITSEEALSDPYNRKLTVYSEDFLKAPFLDNVITDQHFSQRNRQGRLVSFLARIIHDFNIMPKAIAVDEKTAVCIDENGIAKVLGDNHAYFIKTNSSKLPEKIEANQNLIWNQDQKAISVYKIKASPRAAFNVKSFDFSEAKGGESNWWFVEEGMLKLSN